MKISRMLQTEDFRSDEAAGVKGLGDSAVVTWWDGGEEHGGKLLKHLRGQHVGRNADMEVTKNNARSDGDKTGRQA